MSYNNGGPGIGLESEASQLHHHQIHANANGNGTASCNNWPFSVRYTASPYRKSKFHPHLVSSSHSSSSSTPEPTSTSLPLSSSNTNPFSHPHHLHNHVNNNPAGGPIQGVGGPPFLPTAASMNSNLVLNSNSNGSLNHPAGLGLGGTNKFHHEGGNLSQQEAHILLQNHNHHLQSINPLAYPNHFAALKQHQIQQQQLLHQRQRQYDHYHYGLPAVAIPPGVLQQNGNGSGSHSGSGIIGLTNKEKNQQQIMNSYHQFRMRYPGSFERRKQQKQQQRVVHVNPGMNFEQVLDEGYIEDLKQNYPHQIHNHNHHSHFHHQQQQQQNIQQNPPPAYPSHPPPGEGDSKHFQFQNIHNNSSTVGNYNPYNYVYDSQLVQIKEDLSVCSASVNQAFLTNPSTKIPYPLPPLPYQGKDNNESESENEYEEIRDVQRYINMSNYSTGSGGSGSGCVSSSSFGQVLNETLNEQGVDQTEVSLGKVGPKHFKSFSTSTDDILAEVVQVKRKHDRVLDQLNLEVENLLIKSSSEVEIASDYMTMGSCEVALASSANNLNKCPLTLTHNSAFLGGGCNSIETGSIGTGTFGRKKKLERKSVSLFCTPGQCKCHPDGSSGICYNRIDKDKAYSKKNNGEVNIKKLISGGYPDETDEPNPHNHLNCESAKIVMQGKGNKFGQRNYSLIPNWKIRDHLMRLPFLRHHHDKLKKGEGRRGSCTIPSSISGAELSSLENNKFSTKSIMMSTATAASENSSNLNNINIKTKSSSMDELRSTGEDHWYSADSDTEPESLGGSTRAGTTTTAKAINSSEELKANGNGSPSEDGNNGNVNGSVILNGGSVSVVQNNRINVNLYSNCGDHNGSKMDIGTVIPDVPKAPKFRSGPRGSGLKDKWRESWSSHSKTLLKSSSSMEEENRLLRWFSLRKNSVTMDPTSAGSNRHSTLPQLSEEDLKRISFMDDEEGYWPRRTVQPPSLPPPPADLSSEQITRRHIIAAIVHSENNYVAALQRLVNEYKKPLECSHPAILSHSKISSIFHRLPEILQCHSLFRIALAECVRRWDTEEKIGDVFVASFSKSLVLDVYSEFINNFGHAMDTAKVETRRKSAFAEFLKVKQMTAHDRLSLFGLMVKPVQRFPQFILLLQDLLKHTPKDHHDRMSLQLALTQLESLAAMLNERKRESEQYQAFRETIKSIGGGKFVLLRSIVDDPNRILLRQDVVTQLEFDNNGGTVAKSKCRKLLLLNDMLICTTLSGSSSSFSSVDGNKLSRKESIEEENSSNKSSKSEKSVFKWSFPVRDVEVEDISISPTMSRFVQSKSSSTLAGSKPFSPPQPSEDSASITLLEEMQSLMHDYAVLSRILNLVSTLKTTYDGLSVATVKELMLEIQHQIRCRDEQISYFDSSCLTLLLGNGSTKEKVVFQMQSPEARTAWIEELKLAQLALDPGNSPAWDIPSESPYPHHKLPLFVKALPLSKQPHLTLVKCGCFFTHTFVSQTGRSKILDYLWVSSTDGMSSHLTAFRSQQNALKEVSSFDLVEEKVNDMIFVQGYIWVATESRKIMLFDPADTDKGTLSHQFLTASVLKLLLHNNVIYAGLSDGNLAVFTVNANAAEIPLPTPVLQVGNDKIVSMFVSRDYVYAACGNSVVTIDTKTHTIEKSVILNHHIGSISHMACSGVGLWITTQDSGTVCLYHLESFQHLQDVSIAPSVYRTVRDSFRRSKGVHVTSLIAHKGWLWIGTNLGVILTIPLPRLEGVPIISTGNANVSFHGFCGPVTFLMPLTKPPPTNTYPALPSSSNSKKTTDIPSEAASIEDTVADRRNESSVSFSDCVDKSSVNKSESRSNDDILSNNSNSNSPVPNKEHSSPLNGLISNHDKTSSSSSIENNSSPSSSGSKTLVILRKKSSKDNILLRNCKTLPRGGPLPSNLRFSIDSDVYGLYGNLINVRGLEDEGRFVDPLYDALRRSDPELNALDAKISTMDRRLKMRMSRPRSLDLSNWSVDSKISASSDESVGIGSMRINSNGGHSQAISNSTGNTPPPPTSEETDTSSATTTKSIDDKNINLTKESSARNKNRHHHHHGGKGQKSKGPTERTILVVVGGRGYLNMKAMAQEHFISTTDSETKSSPHLTLWQMKT